MPKTTTKAKLFGEIIKLKQKNKSYLLRFLFPKKENFYRNLIYTTSKNTIALLVILLISLLSYQTASAQDSFENSLDDWSNLSGDDFDWTNYSSGTPSGNTGPSSGAVGDYYMYIETSNPRVSGDIAWLQKEFDLTNKANTILTFDYHMYGSNMGELKAYVYDDSNNLLASIFSESGNHGNVWNSESIDLSAYAGMVINIRFEGIRGSGFRGDAAIDNILVASDTDNDGINDYVDLDSDNDGILDTDEGLCVPTDVDGDEAFSILSFGSITNKENAINGNAANGAVFNDNGTYAEITLRDGVDIVSAGTIITILSKKSKNNTDDYMIVSESTDGTVYENEQTITFTNNGKQYRTYTLTTNATHIKIQYDDDDDSGDLNVYSITYPDFTTICESGSDTDTDGDGIPNYLDSDSDNDGCSDADEAYYGTTTNADSDDNGYYGSGTPTVDSDGKVTTASYVAPNYYYSHDSVNTCNDNDNDGVIDIEDLDDDNDGILDSDENYSNFITDPGFDNLTASSFGNNIGASISPWVLGAVSTGADTNIVKVDGTGGYNYGVGGPESDATGGAGNYFDVADGKGEIYQTFTITATADLEFGGYISGRGGSAGYGEILIYSGTNGSSGTELATTGVEITDDNVNWTYLSSITTLSPGSYSFVVDMDDQLSFDQAFLFATPDTDGDGVPNYKDLDSDNDGIPDNIEAQSTRHYTEVSGSGSSITDTNGNGVDDNYEDISNGIVGLTLIDTDGDGDYDYLDLDSDDDGTYDIEESGSGLAQSGGQVTESVGANGLVNTIETGDTDLGYTDVNGEYDDTQTDNFPDADEDVFTIGDVDYRDASLNGIPMLTQIYQDSSERWIEITNLSTDYSIEANTIKIQLYQDKTGDQTGVTPDETFTLDEILTAGQSVIIGVSSNTITNINSAAIIKTDDSITAFADGDDIITLSTENDSNSYYDRYEIIEAFTDNTSYVRIDQIFVPNETYTSTEWVQFIDDGITPYESVDPIASETKRHPQDPLISEIENANSEANILLGLHRTGATTRKASSWTNGYPDRSRFVRVIKNYSHTGSTLSARKLFVKNPAILAVTDNPLVVTNEVEINGEIRLVGTSQLVQTHSDVDKVSGSGVLLVDQNSLVPSLYRYNYMSSPVSTSGSSNTYTIENVFKDGTAPTSSDFTEITGTDIAKDITFIGGYDGNGSTSPIQLAEYWMYTYSPSINDVSNWEHAYKDGVIDKGDGFIFKGPGVVQNYTFEGIPNDGSFDAASSIGGDEIYLIGNPYASALNSNKFIIDNTDAISGTLYFWEQHESAIGEGTGIDGHLYAGYVGGYSTRNRTMGIAANTTINEDTGTAGLGTGTYQEPKEYIAIGQGFFVKGDSDGGTINFNNSQRAYITEGAQSEFLRESQVNSESTTVKTEELLPIIKLGFDYKNSDNLMLHRQIGISFQETNSFEYEKGYDSEVYDSGNTGIYWKFSSDDRKYAITGVQAISDELEVPLEITMGYSGEVTITADEIQNVPSKVYILDKLTGESYQIINNKATLTLDEGIYNERFVLAFKENKALSLEDYETSNLTSIYVDNKTKNIVISKNDAINFSKVTLYSILGKKVNVWEINEQKTSYQLKINNQLSAGVYIVKINTPKGNINKKVVIE